MAFSSLPRSRGCSGRAVKSERHEAPHTAYQRLLASGDLLAKDARRLRDQYASLDPFALAAEVEQRLQKILPVKKEWA